MQHVSTTLNFGNVSFKIWQRKVTICQKKWGFLLKFKLYLYLLTFKVEYKHISLTVWKKQMEKKKKRFISVILNYRGNEIAGIKEKKPQDIINMTINRSSIAQDLL